MFTDPQNHVKQRRFLVLEDGTVWKVEELGRRRIYTGQYSEWYSIYFPSHISRPSKFDGLQYLRMGMIEGTKEKVWWSTDLNNTGYHGKISTFVESSKENKMRELKCMIRVCGTDGAWQHQDNILLHTEPNPNKKYDEKDSRLQGETFYDKKLGSMCICVHEAFSYLEKRGAIFRPLTLASNKDYYFLSCGEIESRIEDIDSHLSECHLRLKTRREKKKSKFQAIKKRKKKLAKAIRRSHFAKMQRNFGFLTESPIRTKQEY